MPINAIIWDMGGVILRTEDPAPRQELADRLGLTRTDLEELVFHSPSGLRAQRGEITYEEHWRNLQQALQLPVESLPAVQRSFWGGDHLDLELIADIRGMRAQYKIGLLSNAFSDLRQVITQEWNMADLFDDMVISAEVGIMKPDPRSYRLVVDRLGVRPAEAVFVDDFQHNVNAALTAGFQAIRFLNRRQAWTELQSRLVASL
jgi:epoxide hydrolase-like predicted phosphatase